MEIPKSTIRFSQVVKECGRPEPVTLWAAPEKDPSFQAAVRMNRVMTVIQETVGTRKDFGVVGFQQVKNASYWLFPKPLDAFQIKRVIGINYDLVQVPKAKDSVQAAAESAKKTPPKDEEKPIKDLLKKPPQTPVEKTQPELVRYRVTIRSITTVDVQREVEAETAKQAGEQALGIVANESVEFPAEKVSRKVVGVRRVKT